MAGSVKPVPDGYHTITPYLVLRDGAAAIDFYKRAFGAEEYNRMPGPGGKGVMHAELRIGDSIVMLSDEFPGMSKSPQSLGGTPVGLYVYVRDVDAVWQRAVSAGAKVAVPLADMFWGDRYGKLVDPFGHEWSLATHVKDLTPDEMRKAAEKAFAQMQKGS